MKESEIPIRFFLVLLTLVFEIFDGLVSAERFLFEKAGRLFFGSLGRKTFPEGTGTRLTLSFLARRAVKRGKFKLESTFSSSSPAIYSFIIGPHWT